MGLVDRRNNYETRELEVLALPPLTSEEERGSKLCSIIYDQ
jgi:hypothetical protein